MSNWTYGAAFTARRVGGLFRRSRHESDRQNHAERQRQPGKLADAELHFTDGELEGLKPIGFSIWERRTGNGRNVTFPARQYAVNGERRSFALLRPITDASAQERVRDLVLDAYAEYDERAAIASDS
jgi:hypothetical protein